jgi:DNA polymerase III epsilon subunit family exonuclease
MTAFTIVDLETTGLSPSYHKIIEIAALRYKDGKITRRFKSLVDPESRIPRFITRLTGIDEGMVEGKPTIDKVLPRLKRFLGEHAFVAHNAGFDFRFLDNAYIENLGINMQNAKICTCRLARRLLPELPSKRLANICEHFDIKNNAVHRAMGDALATSKIFHNFLEMMKEKQIHEVDDILKFQSSKIPKI